MSGLCLFLFFTSGDSTATLVHKVSESGRVFEIAVPVSERLSPAPEVPPGSPPVLSFRLLDGQLRHRFGNLDLVLDDAGH